MLRKEAAVGKGAGSGWDADSGIVGGGTGGKKLENPLGDSSAHRPAAMMRMQSVGVGGLGGGGISSHTLYHKNRP